MFEFMKNLKLKNKIKARITKLEEFNKDLGKKILKDYYKVDDFREEHIDGFVANEILKKLDENSSVDQVEEVGIEAGLSYLSPFLAKYNVTLSEDCKKKVADGIVKGISIANKALQKKLNETSNSYKKRHQA
jgi:D-hexose-6-phosphate mutarotase